MKNKRIISTHKIVSTIFLLYLSTTFLTARVIEEVTQYRKKEIVHGQEFVYVYNDSIRQLQEEWLIDGKSVEQEIFLQQKARAHYQELVERESKERERQEQELKTRKRLRCEIAKKCLIQLLNEIERIVQCMKEYSLTDFVEFSKTTFETSDAYNVLLTQIITEVRSMIGQACEEINESRMQELVHEMEQYKEKLNRFFQDALSHAIERSDDTKLLKRLFELVS